MSLRIHVAVASACAAVLTSSSAFAHVSVSSPAFAKQSALLTFSIGHGCEGADSSQLDITIPESVTSVRAMPSLFGAVEIQKNAAGTVTHVIWTNPAPRKADDLFYQAAIRATMPDAPFTTLLFPAKQTCKAADGKESTVDWVATPEQVANAKQGEEPEPAPAVAILPLRKSGWNKFTVKSKLSDLTIFDDAEIVWAGEAAYSGNTSTQDQIKNEDGVSELKEIAAGTEIWVKY
jgi:uncharacterized protein YcnI